MQDPAAPAWRSTSGAWWDASTPVRRERIVMELDLEQARRRAKERLRAARSGELVLREDREPRLADAQRAVANELGFPSWPALVAHAETAGGTREERRARLVAHALAGRADRAEALLAADPALARAGLDVALVLGDAEAVAAALARDAGLVSRELPVPGRRPLSCACHSAFLAPGQARAPGVRRVVELLLEAGADPNETFDNEYGAMPSPAPRPTRGSRRPTRAPRTAT